jgi:hypothetical protein
MNSGSMRRLTLVVAVIAAAAVAGCGGASIVDDVGRGAARGADEVPAPPRSGPDDLPGLGGAADEVESAQARGVLESMTAGDERTWVCLGLDVVEAASDGDPTFEEYATGLMEHGFGHVPAYRVEQAYNASVQLLYGDLSQLQDLACL